MRTLMEDEEDSTAKLAFPTYIAMCMAESSEETSAERSLTYFVSPLLSVSI